MAITDGITGFLAYAALILSILCAIGEKWTYFSSLLDDYSYSSKKKKKHKKKKKKHHKKVTVSNDDFYRYCGIV